ncbi:MAG: DUF3386 family protein [Armatimonadetes bacterium]|nr:DUF3386 family protein [Armatimonadota bacterium]
MTASGANEITYEGAADRDMAELVRSEIRAMVGELHPTPFEMREGRWPVSYATDAPRFGPPCVWLQVGNPIETRVRLRDGRIDQTQWKAGHVAMSMAIQGLDRSIDGRDIMRGFMIVFQHPETRELMGVNSYYDDHSLIDGIHLPVNRNVVLLRDGEPMRRELVLRGHRVLRAGG